MRRIYHFGEYQLDVERRALLRSGAPVAVPPRAFDLLQVLVEQRHRVLPKEELLEHVWPAQIVEEGNLSQQIFVLRRLLGAGDWIATVPRRGYQFVAPVSEVALPPRSAAAMPGPTVLHGELLLAPHAVLGPVPALTLARDGRLLVYVGEHVGGTALYVRRLDRRGTSLIPGTEGAAGPFLSPDARWVGFGREGRLWRAALDGGEPIALCDVEGIGRGACWGPNHLIVFAPRAAGPLFVVSAAGGAARPLTRLKYAEGERSHRFPAFQPDGQTVVFTVACAGDATFDRARLAATTLEGGSHRVVLEQASCGMFAPASGNAAPVRLYYQRAGFLFSAAWDAAAAACASSIEPVQPIAVHEAGAAHATAAAGGLVAAAPPDVHRMPPRLVWRRPGGDEDALAAPPGVPEEPRLAPDGRRAVVGVRAEHSDLWLLDLSEGTYSRLTDAGDNFAAIWAPDGRHVVFSSNRSGPSNVYHLRLGALAPTRLTQSPCEQVPAAWTADGRLLFTQYDARSGATLWCREPEGETHPLIQSRFNEYAPALSPDGQWLAYTSDAPGIPEIFVIRFPSLSDRRQVSQGGGFEPVWRPGTSTLLFRTPAGLAQTCIADDAAGALQQIADASYVPGSPTGLPNYDVHADGRLLVVAPARVANTRDHFDTVIPCGGSGQ